MSNKPSEKINANRLGNSPVLISNHEVHTVLAEGKKNQFEKEVLTYIETNRGTFKNVKDARNCVEILGQYGLTEGEKIQFLNLKPRAEVEVNLVRFTKMRRYFILIIKIVDECAERLSDEQTLKLIQDLSSMYN